jgi:hypothetical protein
MGLRDLWLSGIGHRQPRLAKGAAVAITYDLFLFCLVPTSRSNPPSIRCFDVIKRSRLLQLDEQSNTAQRDVRRCDWLRPLRVFLRCNLNKSYRNRPYKLNHRCRHRYSGVLCVLVFGWTSLEPLDRLYQASNRRSVVRGTYTVLLLI